MQANRNNVIVLVFFDSKGLLYMNIMPKGVSVNADHIFDTLGKFMKIFKKQEVTAG